MMNYWGHSDDIFDQGYKTLRKGVLLFGLFFTALGIMIFMFPKLIAYIFAFFILTAGIFGLLLGYRIWKLRNQARPFDWVDDPLKSQVDVETPASHRRTITFIMR